MQESRHFIFDPSLRGCLSANISPANFNSYLKRMYLAYDAMPDLIGRAPCGGDKITIKKGEPNIGFQYVNIGAPFIYWDPSYIVSILSGLEANPYDWRFGGTTHELGHLYDEDGPNKWRFTSEGMATYKAWPAIEKCGGKVRYTNDGTNYFYEAPLTHNWDINYYGHMKNVYNDPSGCRSFIGNGNYGDDIVFLLNPILNELGFSDGWNILKSVFRSYYDSSYPVNSFLGNQAQQSISICKLYYSINYNINFFHLIRINNYF